MQNGRSADRRASQIGRTSSTLWTIGETEASRLSGVALVLLCSGLAAACRAAGPAAPAALPADVLAEVRETGPLATGRFVAERKWLAAEQGVGHLTGRAAADGAAKNGTAWEVRADAAKAGTALFGPYLELPPGDYLTLFRVRLVPAPDGDNGDSLGTFDACVGFGNEILASRELTESDLFPRRYTVVPLPFHYGGGKLECRFQWSGCGGLRLDQVALFRIVGGMAVESIGRVAPPVPSGRPCELPYHSEPRPFADIFPRSAAPATTLLVLDLRKELPDVRLATHCLQGLVNRIQPRIYCYTGDTDVFWLDQMVRRHRIEKIETVATPAALLARFRGVVRGMVVADPRLPAAGGVVERRYKGRDIVVNVREEGFEYDGKLYKSLSAIAREVTGSKWNGFLFFGCAGNNGGKNEKR